MEASASNWQNEPETIELRLDRQNGRINIGWTCATENEISHYTIEKSKDGKIFQELAIQMTGDDKWIGRSFTYSDKLIKGNSGRVFYRIRQNNKNGTFNYSTVQSI